MEDVGRVVDAAGPEQGPVAVPGVWQAATSDHVVAVAVEGRARGEVAVVAVQEALVAARVARQRVRLGAHVLEDARIRPHDQNAAVEQLTVAQHRAEGRAAAEERIDGAERDRVRVRVHDDVVGQAPELELRVGEAQARIADVRVGRPRRRGDVVERPAAGC